MYLTDSADPSQAKPLDLDLIPDGKPGANPRNKKATTAYVYLKEILQYLVANGLGIVHEDTDGLILCVQLAEDGGRLYPRLAGEVVIYHATTFQRLAAMPVRRIHLFYEDNSDFAGVFVRMELGSQLSPETTHVGQ